MLSAVILSALLRECAPNIGARTMAAVVRVESGGQALTIHDNTIGRTFTPTDANQGVAWANQLLALRHSIDLGLSQINSANLARLGMSVRETFDPCLNLAGGASILEADYRAAAEQFGPGQFALRRALGAYNSGSLYAGYGYTQRILEAAGVAAQDDFFVPDVQRVGQSFVTTGAKRPVAISKSRLLSKRELITLRRAVPGVPTDRRAKNAPIIVDPRGSDILVHTGLGDAKNATAPPVSSPEQSSILPAAAQPIAVQPIDARPTPLPSPT